MWPRSSSTGTVSVNAPEPVRCHVSVTAVSGARWSTKSTTPPLCRNVSSCGPSSPGVPAMPRSSRTVSVRPGHQEARLPGARDQLVVREDGRLGEDLPVRPVPHARPGPGAGDLADDRELGPGDERLERVVRTDAVAVVEDAGLAAVERHAVRATAAVDLDVEARRQRVDDGRADAVQTAGRPVRAAAELAAGVQLGEHDLDAGQAGLRLDVHRDAAAVVAHLDGGVGVQHDLDPVAVAAERLVDRVVDDLPQAVHEAAAVGGADVHAGALAHRLEPFEHRQVPGGVAGLRGGRRHGADGSRGPDSPAAPCRRPRVCCGLVTVCYAVSEPPAPGAMDPAPGWFY